MTATAVMKLVHDGRVDLRAPVRSYLPGFHVLDDETSRTVSPWHCLTHTPGWEGQLTTEDRGAEALAHFATAIMPTLPQLARPGEIWSYNNAGFALTGRLLEVVTGQLDSRRPARAGVRAARADAYLHASHRRDDLPPVARPPRPRRPDRGDPAVPDHLEHHGRRRAYERGRPDGLRARAFGRRPRARRRALPVADRARPDADARSCASTAPPTRWASAGTCARWAAWPPWPTAARSTAIACCVQLVPSRQLAFTVLTNHQDGWRLVQDVEHAILRRYAGVALASGQAIGHRGVNEAMTFHAQPKAVQPALAEYEGTYPRPPVGTVEVRRRRATGWSWRPAPTSPMPAWRSMAPTSPTRSMARIWGCPTSSSAAATARCAGSA